MTTEITVNEELDTELWPTLWLVEQATAVIIVLANNISPHF